MSRPLWRKGLPGAGHTLGRIAGLLAALGVAAVILWLVYNYLISAWVAPLLFPQQLHLMQAESQKPPDHSKEIQALLSELNGDFGNAPYAISVKNLHTGEVINKNETKLFDAASTSKLVIAAYVYSKAAAGSLSLGTKATIKESDLESGSGVIKTAGGTFTYRELVKAMLKHSDNAAANALVRILSRAKIHNYGLEIGLKHTNRLKGNESTAEDLRHVAELIYEGKVTTKTLTAELLGNLQNTDFEDRLPVLLPEGANVYHKIGNGIGGEFHDVGVVEYHGITYSIAVLTDDFKTAKLARAAIQKASLRIFKYETEVA